MDISLSSMCAALRAVTGLPVQVVQTSAALEAVDGLFQLVNNSPEFSVWNIGNGQSNDDGSDVVIGYVILAKGHDYHNE